MDEKISREFAARLDQRAPKDLVRAVVLVAPDSAPRPTKRSALRRGRKARVEAARESLAGGLPEIDSILGAFGGRRLDHELGALGGVAVEVVPAGIRALADCEKVRAILEDQSISLIR